MEELDSMKVGPVGSTDIKREVCITLNDSDSAGYGRAGLH